EEPSRRLPEQLLVLAGVVPHALPLAVDQHRTTGDEPVDLLVAISELGQDLARVLADARRSVSREERSPTGRRRAGPTETRSPDRERARPPRSPPRAGARTRGRPDRAPMASR